MLFIMVRDYGDRRPRPDDVSLSEPKPFSAYGRKHRSFAFPVRDVGEKRVVIMVNRGGLAGEPLVVNAMEFFPRLDVEIKRRGFLRTVNFSTKGMQRRSWTVLMLCGSMPSLRKRF